MKPFLKWAGGKYRLIPFLKSKFPEAKRYIEPFLGAGAVALNVDYPEFIVNDVNSDLIAVWKALKTYKEGFINACESLFVPENNNKPAFLEFKKQFNRTVDSDDKAIMFIYLNRHCFNGLCRYNSKGGFNTSFGAYKVPYFPRNELLGVLDKIQNFEIHNLDFKEIFALVKEGDLVYCDPPYFPLSETSSFTTYSAGGFGLMEHIKLAEEAKLAAERGATVFISNCYNWYSRELYSGYGAKTYSVDCRRCISGDGDKRGSVKEIVAEFR